MANTIVDNVAVFIRTTDPDNTMPADTLGWKIAEYLTSTGRPVPPTALSAYVLETNPTKQVGAGRLAQLVTDRFAVHY